ncbi:MAG: twin-arginine translocase TatA/TatE family subunit [Luteolibacter sp.]
MNMPLAILSPVEIALVLIVLLLLFGAKKLPELARGMGKSLSEFHKGKAEGEITDSDKKPSDKQP